MRKRLLLLLLIVSAPIWAQENPALKGLVTDSNGAPIEAVTCLLTFRADSSYVNAAISGLDGQFEISPFPDGSYLLTLQHLLFEQVTILVEGGHDLPLATTVMKEKNLELAGIVVTGERPVVKAQDGKLVYDVPQLISNKIATNAFEALKTIPNVSGGGDDIQLVGTDNYTILINGQPTSLSASQLVQLLKSTPASKVKNIEVMYSAPPQYNVRGAAINVILSGGGLDIPTFQGEGALTYDQASHAGYGARANIVYNQPAYTVDLTVGGNTGERLDHNLMHAVHQLDNHVYDIKQDNRADPSYSGLDTRLALDYTLPNKDKVNLTYTGSHSKNNFLLESNALYTMDNAPYADINSEGDNTGNNWLHNLKLAYTSHFNLKAGIDYTFYNESGRQLYNSFDNNQLLQSFKTESGQRIGKLLAYANHAVTTGSGWQWTYGGNFGYSRNKNDYDWFASVAGQTPDSVSLTRQTEYSGSAYAGFSKSFTPKFSMQLSLSGNYFRATVDNSEQGERTLWNEFAPFVNANLTYVFTPQHILQGAFTSDVQYPPYWALSPDVVRLNAYSVVEGNPQLKFSKSYEGQLVYIFKSKYMLIGAYKHYSDFVIQLPKQSTEELVNVFQMVNLDYRKQATLSLVVPVKVGTVLDSRGTFTYVYMKDKDSDFYSTPYAQTKNSFVFNLTNTVNISTKPNIKLEVTAFYMNGAIQGVYEVEPMSSINAGLKWTLPNNRAEFTAKVNDIFSDMDANTVINFADQQSNMTIFADTPSFNLSFIYRFGNYKKKQVEEVDKSRFGR